jgi:hypothetical protein
MMNGCKLTIRQHAIAHDLLAGERHTLGRRAINHRPADAPVEKRLDDLEQLVRSYWRATLRNFACEFDDISL